ncbi:hypothetical protein CsSME_00031156 [Camellia sinensis var. sinensis]
MPTMHPRLEEEFPHAPNEEATIVYQLQGRQAEFQYEKTSLSTSLNEDFAMEFSSFDFEDNRRAMEHLATSKIFKESSYVVDGYFVDGSGVLFEKVGQDIFSYRLIQYTISMYRVFYPNTFSFMIYNRDSTQQSSSTIAQRIDLM